MPLAFPRERPAWIYETQYLFGPDLLVAPIVEPGGRVELWLPGGTWVDVWTGEAVVGGRALTRTGVPLDRLPVYAAAGAPGGLVGAFGFPRAGA
jgi:alpha-D-xyloside xylohydrolase